MSRWPQRTLAERFDAHVAISDDGCHVWTGYIDAHGYGRFTVSSERKSQLAHRVAYELKVCPIAPGMTIDHLCRNRACVNVSHLEQVTLAENKQRGQSPAMLNKAKDECDNGHAFTEANTYRTREGWRACRTCHRDRQRARYAQRAA